jgi:hypothetical protein
MDTSPIYLLETARRAYSKVERILTPNKAGGLPIDYAGQEASDKIQSKILDDKPCMICRFGSTEFNATIRYFGKHRPSKFPLDKSINYILGNAEAFWWNERTKADMSDLSGFFPVTDRSLEDFSIRMLKDIENIDILGSWIPQEIEVADLLKRAAIVRLVDLEPYYHINPWSEALAGKVVLVIHPFEQSIQQQYKQRKLLFKDERILPEFELKTLKSIQSIAGNNTEFKSWFDALDWMCEKINNIEFDVAIIGAGAYGLPLASHIKNIGKKAVHLGGSTQILFGIKGQRWDDHPVIKELYNQYWVKPLPSEVPNNHRVVEGGCYW